MNETGLDFQGVHEEYRPRILRYLTRLVGESEAEDLTQEVFLRISRSLGAFRGESRLSTWVYRIATHAALDRLRAPSFKREVARGFLDGSVLSDSGVREGGVEFEDCTASVEERINDKERLECYLDSIKDLPVSYRAIVALSEVEGLMVRQIAEILGLSEDVVKIRLHRGRKKLLLELKSRCKPEDWL